MSEYDAAIWDKFLAQHKPDFARVEYDVRVGHGIPLKEEWEIAIKEMAKALTQKRIDVVAWKGVETWLIEVDQRAGVNSLGQLMTYKHLYEKEYGKARPIKLVVVAGFVTPEDKSILEAHGVKVFQV